VIPTEKLSEILSPYLTRIPNIHLEEADLRYLEDKKGLHEDIIKIFEFAGYNVRGFKVESKGEDSWALIDDNTKRLTFLLKKEGDIVRIYVYPHYRVETEILMAIQEYQRYPMLLT